MTSFLYILQSSSSGKYYVGVSLDPQRRLFYHNTIEKGFTARYRPWENKFTKEYATKTEVLAAERKLKSWKSRKMIERIISGELQL